MLIYLAVDIMTVLVQYIELHIVLFPFNIDMSPVSFS